jgi:hypothetical protein
MLISRLPLLPAFCRLMLREFDRVENGSWSRQRQAEMAFSGATASARLGC